MDNPTPPSPLNQQLRQELFQRRNSAPEIGSAVKNDSRSSRLNRATWSSSSAITPTTSPAQERRNSLKDKLIFALTPSNAVNPNESSSLPRSTSVSSFKSMHSGKTSISSHKSKNTSSSNTKKKNGISEFQSQSLSIFESPELWAEFRRELDAHHITSAVGVHVMLQQFVSEKMQDGTLLLDEDAIDCGAELDGSNREKGKRRASYDGSTPTKIRGASDQPKLVRRASCFVGSLPSSVGGMLSDLSERMLDKSERSCDKSGLDKSYHRSNLDGKSIHGGSVSGKSSTSVLDNPGKSSAANTDSDQQHQEQQHEPQPQLQKHMHPIKRRLSGKLSLGSSTMNNDDSLRDSMWSVDQNFYAQQHYQDVIRGDSEIYSSSRMKVKEESGLQKLTKSLSLSNRTGRTLASSTMSSSGGLSLSSRGRGSLASSTMSNSERSGSAYGELNISGGAGNSFSRKNANFDQWYKQMTDYKIEEQDLPSQSNNDNCDETDNDKKSCSECEDKVDDNESTCGFTSESDDDMNHQDKSSDDDDNSTGFLDFPRRKKYVKSDIAKSWALKSKRFSTPDTADRSNDNTHLDIGMCKYSSEDKSISQEVINDKQQQEATSAREPTEGDEPSEYNNKPTIHGDGLRGSWKPQPVQPRRDSMNSTSSQRSGCSSIDGKSFHRLPSDEYCTAFNTEEGSLRNQQDWSSRSSQTQSWFWRRSVTSSLSSSATSDQQSKSQFNDSFSSLNSSLTTLVTARDSARSSLGEALLVEWGDASCESLDDDEYEHDYNAHESNCDYCPIGTTGSNRDIKYSSDGSSNKAVTYFHWPSENDSCSSGEDEDEDEVDLDINAMANSKRCSTSNLKDQPTPLPRPKPPQHTEMEHDLSQDTPQGCRLGMLTKKFSNRTIFEDSEEDSSLDLTMTIDNIEPRLSQSSITIHENPNEE